MLLTEEHIISRDAGKALFREVDDYCYRAKNLCNSVNYLIRQSCRIQRKLQGGEALESWETELVSGINEAVRIYNAGRDKTRQIRCVDENNGFIADAYFLSWYLKTTPEYRAMPYATCSQICIQDLCRAWKSFYAARSAYRKNPEGFTGCPQRPGYLGKTDGRGWLVITNQNCRIDENGSVRMPGFLRGIHIRARHGNVRQIRVRTEKTCIRILLIYEEKEDTPGISGKGTAVMGIDLGVDNLVTAVWNSDHAPVIINGKALKSINQYYNKKRAGMQSAGKKKNRSDRTRRSERLTQKRNRKIRDQMHKASRKIVSLAEESGTGLIVIGNNKGWKQHVTLGNRTNQNFVSIPYGMMIGMICYKAALAGIEVRVVNESYTSGTSYLDGEAPEKQYYDRSRRIHRGLFKSNAGSCINPDVNAACQILKSDGVKDLRIKQKERITRIKVS